MTPAEIGGHDCLCFTFRPSPSFWPFLVDGQAVQLPVTGSVRINNGETARQMALMGAGIARLGHFHVAADLAAGRLVAVLEAFNGGDVEAIHALHVGGGPVPHRVRAFVDFLGERVRREMGG
jgi:DNA-binding transcriptional LysR family regulator